MYDARAAPLARRRRLPTFALVIDTARPCVPVIRFARKVSWAMGAPCARPLVVADRRRDPPLDQGLLQPRTQAVGISQRPVSGRVRDGATRRRGRIGRGWRGWSRGWRVFRRVRGFVLRLSPHRFWARSLLELSRADAALLRTSVWLGPKGGRVLPLSRVMAEAGGRGGALHRGVQSTSCLGRVRRGLSDRKGFQLQCESAVLPVTRRALPPMGLGLSSAA